MTTGPHFPPGLGQGRIAYDVPRQGLAGDEGHDEAPLQIVAFLKLEDRRPGVGAEMTAHGGRQAVEKFAIIRHAN